MTAGRSAGTEQGRGREELVLVAYELHPGDVIVAVEDDVYDGEPRMTVHRPSPSVPPARDSGRDEAREAVARWLCDTYEPALDWPDLDPDERRVYRVEADELLSLPAVAALLRDGTTT